MTSAQSLPQIGSVGIPTFGVGAALVYRPFGLTVIRRGANGEPDTSYVEQFSAAEMDAGALMQMMNAPTEMAMVRALSRSLLKTLDDADGVPAAYSPPAEAEVTEDGEDFLRTDPTEEEPEGLLLFRRWDGELVTDPLELIPEPEQGSSLRRFSELMSSPDLYVPSAAFLELAEHLVSSVTARPTKRPRPSGSGQRPTGRGSAAPQR